MTSKKYNALFEWETFENDIFINLWDLYGFGYVSFNPL